MDSGQFVSRLKDIVQNYRTVYMWGVFGAPVSERIIAQKAKQYPSWYTPARQQSLRKLAGFGYFGFDCVNLIKGVLWGWCGDSMQSFGGARYQSNNVPDVSADGLLKLLRDISSSFSGIMPGEVVWLPGHVGVYLGDGLVIEATPAWENGVQITKCLNVTGGAPGWQARFWRKHGKLPWIRYEG